MGWGGSDSLVPNSTGATATLPGRRMTCHLPAAGSTTLSGSAVRAASFSEMQIQGTPSMPELLSVPSEEILLLCSGCVFAYLFLVGVDPA